MYFNIVPHTLNYYQVFYLAFNPLIVETSRGTVRQDMESHVMENVMVYYTGEEVNCTLDVENRDILYNGTSIANDK